MVSLGFENDEEEFHYLSESSSGEDAVISLDLTKKDIFEYLNDILLAEIALLTLSNFLD